MHQQSPPESHLKSAPQRAQTTRRGFGTRRMSVAKFIPGEIYSVAS
jgi:hypothetical protein